MGILDSVSGGLKAVNPLESGAVRDLTGGAGNLLTSTGKSAENVSEGAKNASTSIGQGIGGGIDNISGAAANIANGLSSPLVLIGIAVVGIMLLSGRNSN